VTGASAAERRERFEAALGFSLDDFQRRALDRLDGGDHVLVSAPTGSGKTLVAAYAIDRARSVGRKAFYTTPLKALSNQKFAELMAEHGSENVGLLTGDSAIRPFAPIVVMTTEVLRNMLLTSSPLLGGLGCVILDEVHFIQDPYRGGVWEEVLIMADPAVQFCCLSATVSNASVLGAWIESVRGPTSVIVERDRPIELHHAVGITKRGAERPQLIDLLDAQRPTAECLRIDGSLRRRPSAGRPHPGGGRTGGPPRPYFTPRRSELLELLDDDRLLPAIVFIFSRAACDDAVRQVLRDGFRLAARSDRIKIRAIVEHFVEDLDDEELRALGFAEFSEALEAGIAAHHAGMVPAFREAVEVCFSEGLLGVVFATETLSLGINMPARTVVLERMTKYGGSGRALLTSGEYAQMTGRAGRRGLDAEGHAIVLWNPETPLSEVARIAVAPPPELHSSFRPTYNLASSLVRRYDRAQALELLGRSFAQFEVDHHHRSARRSVAEGFARRMAVLEERGYVADWTLTDEGERLCGIYHEADLLLMEMVRSEVFDGAEPSVLCGVLSGLVFEPRRARRLPGGAPRRHRRAKRGALPDRLGDRRRRDLAQRLELAAGVADRLRAVEEVHLVPRTRGIEGGLATAVAAWSRGADLGTVLEVAARDVGEVAPGDLVRVLKQVADLAEQLARVAPQAELSAAAHEGAASLLRSVVAHGPEASHVGPMAAP
jgi:ATP-dependent RNA helicase HelY